MFSIGSHILNVTKAFGYPKIRCDPTVLAALFQINNGQVKFPTSGYRVQKADKGETILIRVFFDLV